MAKRLIAQKPFEFSARVTLQLGRESISSSTVAISELLKNSYDADAEKVDLNFYLREQGAVSTLIIKDNGIGMDVSTLFDHWLKIGTDNKAIVGHSHNKKRVLTGAKGLGRLGIDRLCKKLILYSKKEGEDKAIQLNVDWRNFENTNKSLYEILHNIYEVDLPINDKYGDIFTNKDECGTYLVLVGLKDVWTPEFISSLSNELRLLISPYRGKNDFAVNLSTLKNNEKTSFSINSEEILAAANWKVNSYVNKLGQVSADFVNNKTKETVRLAPVEWNKWIKNEGDSPLFGPLSFEFHFLPRDTESLKKLKLKTFDWKRFMDLNRGVRIYRDDFRVRPYGEPTGKGDWLDLGFRKASNPSAISQGNWNIGPHQIVGAIKISRETNAILDDQANREGLVENDAFYQMRSFVIKVIETFESLIHKDAVREDDTDLADELRILISKHEESLNEAVGNLKRTFSNKPKGKAKGKKKLPPAKVLYQRMKEFERAKKNHEKALDEYYAVLQKEKVKLQEEKDTLSNLASIGILTVCFGHEIRTHSSLALENTDEILDIVNDSKSGVKEIDYDDLEKITDTVKNSVHYVDDFSRLAINNINPDKRTRNKNNVPKIFNYIFTFMKSTLEHMGVKHDFQFVRISPEDFNVRSFEIDWESIAINFLTNSLWALENKRHNERNIRVIFERVHGTKLKLSFMDSGCGLEIGTEESIFLPMKSSKRDRIGNSIGTGMGLAIVRTHVIDHMSGNITAEVDSALGGAAFHIEVQQDN
jgi:signal transduction histidine kinase